MVNQQHHKPKHDARHHPMRRATDRPQRPAGIGAYISGLLLSGKPNEEVLALTQRTFPASRTSAAAVSWYKAKLKKEGKLD